MMSSEWFRGPVSLHFDVHNCLSDFLFPPFWLDSGKSSPMRAGLCWVEQNTLGAFQNLYFLSPLPLEQGWGGGYFSPPKILRSCWGSQRWHSGESWTPRGVFFSQAQSLATAPSVPAVPGSRGSFRSWRVSSVTLLCSFGCSGLPCDLRSDRTNAAGWFLVGPVCFLWWRWARWPPSSSHVEAETGSSYPLIL